MALPSAEWLPRHDRGGQHGPVAQFAARGAKGYGAYIRRRAVVLDGDWIELNCDAVLDIPLAAWPSSAQMRPGLLLGCRAFALRGNQRLQSTQQLKDSVRKQV